MPCASGPPHPRLPHPRKDPMDVETLPSLPLGTCQKALPPDAGALTVTEFLATSPRLGDLTTPILALGGPAMAANTRTMAAYCAHHGVALAPHGKTTMAPELWQRQLDAGAWGITVANPAQLAVAREFGVPRVQLANSLVDPHGIALAQSMTADGTELVSWVDDVRTVERLTQLLDPSSAPLDVLVELGSPGARTGARGVGHALDVARAAHASPVLRLRGVAGYEGALAHDRSPSSLDLVEAFLDDLKELYTASASEGLFDGEDLLVTAGGSAYFELVVSHLADLARDGADGPRVTVLLRSGAYIVHDDGFYRGITPFADPAEASAFLPGMHAWARVVSRPEPTLALVDAGKRDLPFDEGLPEPQRAQSGFGSPARDLTGATAIAMNDQHTFLRIDAEDPLTIGDVVRLGLSHPCTAIDKWRLIPEIDDADAADPAVVGLLRTYF